MRRLRTVELFCGIGGFRLAADAWGLETVWANDVSAPACRVYRDRLGGPLVEGDIHRHLESIPPHDLLSAGLPCQPFSSAGKKNGVRDPRGSLFGVLVSVLRTHEPRYFVIENVKRLLAMERGEHFGTILGRLSRLPYRLEWRLLNAMHLGLPQNRQRVFLVGRRVESARDQDDFDLTASLLLPATDRPVGPARLAPRPIRSHGRPFPNWGMARCGRFAGMDLTRFSQARPVVPLRQVLVSRVDPQFDFTQSTLHWIGNNTPVDRLVDGVQILSNQEGGRRMGYTIFGIEGVAPALTSTTSRHYERYRVEDRYRRLTNVEYARIQGFADDHCRAVPAHQQYVLYGNAVPPPMVHWVLGRLLAEPGSLGAPALVPVRGSEVRRARSGAAGWTVAVH